MQKSRKTKNRKTITRKQRGGMNTILGTTMNDVFRRVFRVGSQIGLDRDHGNTYRIRSKSPKSPKSSKSPKSPKSPKIHIHSQDNVASIADIDRLLGYYYPNLDKKFITTQNIKDAIKTLKIKTDKDGNYTGSLQGLNYGLKEAPSDLYRIQQYILEKSKSK